MKRAVFTGLCTALVTPFRGDGVNYEMLEALIERQIRAGADAIVLDVKTGSGALMETVDDAIGLAKAMADIGVETCIYVGDSEVDVETAQNAGVKCLSVLWGFRDRDVIEQAGGKYFCEETSQLVEKIEDLIHG